MEKNDFAFLAAVLIGFCLATMAALFLAGARSSEAAGWAQAIGTVAAIAGSAALTRWQANKAAQLSKNERDVAAAQLYADRVLRAQLLIVLLIGYIKSLRDKASLLKLRVAAYPNNNDILWLRHLKIEVPARLADAVFDTNVDPMTFKPVVNILLAIEEYNAFIDFLSSVQPHGREGENAFRDELEKRRALAERLCTEHMNNVATSLQPSI